MNNEKPFIREMKEKDIDCILEVENICFSIPWSRTMFEDEVYNPNAHYLVVELSNEIIGYIGFWKIIDEGHITNVAVHPDFRGKGFGKALISALIQKANELNIIALTLEVRKSNRVAISLYESFGFVSSGIRKKYYSDNNEDALIMWLTL